jgi:hypothetical protein
MWLLLVPPATILGGLVIVLEMWHMTVKRHISRTIT